MKHRRMWEYLSLLIRAALLPEGEEKESAEAQMDMFWTTLDAGELAFINYVAEHIAKDLGEQKRLNGELQVALQMAITELGELMAGSNRCGDPDAECPLHDSHKDWSTKGIVDKCRKALENQPPLKRNDEADHGCSGCNGNSKHHRVGCEASR